MASNYPPGVTGTEPQITGEWPCANCGAVLPEAPDCPECSGGEMEFVEFSERADDPTDGVFVCECGHTMPGDFDTCPGGCREPEWEPA